MLRTVALSLVRGFTMGAADIVPGVSGGTIALIFGIYDRLITSVRAGSSALGHLLRGDLAGTRMWLSRIDWVFILPLGGGLLVAVALLSGVLKTLLLNQAVLMASLFVGLVAGSIVVTWQMIPRIGWRHVLIMAGVAVLLFVSLGLRSGTTEDAVSQLADPALLAYFGAGAIAICAMILPGVSGSFLLILMGMYGPVLGAVTDRDFLALGVFVAGTIVGLALFSQVLHKALSTHHDAVVAALIGLMGGSMRVLWPWPLGVDSTVIGAPDSQIAAAVAIAAVAFVLVIVVARFAQRLERADRALSDVS